MRFAILHIPTATLVGDSAHYEITGEDRVVYFESSEGAKEYLNASTFSIDYVDCLYLFVGEVPKHIPPIVREHFVVVEVDDE